MRRRSSRVERAHVLARADEAELLGGPEAQAAPSSARRPRADGLGRLDQRRHAAAVVVDARAARDRVEVGAGHHDAVRAAAGRLGDHVVGAAAARDGVHADGRGGAVGVASQRAERDQHDRDLHARTGEGPARDAAPAFGPSRRPPAPSRPARSALRALSRKKQMPRSTSGMSRGPSAGEVGLRAAGAGGAQAARDAPRAGVAQDLELLRALEPAAADDAGRRRRA